MVWDGVGWDVVVSAILLGICQNVTQLLFAPTDSNGPKLLANASR